MEKLGDKNMITKDNLNEKDMIDAINEFEVLYRVYKKKLDEMIDSCSDSDWVQGEISAFEEILGDVNVILKLLEQKKFGKPELVK